MSALLSVRAVTTRFGGLLANDAISFDVPTGALYAVILPHASVQSARVAMVGSVTVSGAR